jgi:hypothetical protein
LLILEQSRPYFSLVPHGLHDILKQYRHSINQFQSQTEPLGLCGTPGFLSAILGTPSEAAVGSGMGLPGQC